MHHYGEGAVEVLVFQNTFQILLRNHETGAEIAVTGPLEGVFESKARKIEQSEVTNLGYEIAHFLRDYLK